METDKSRAWLHELYERWDFFNWYYLRTALKRPVIRLSDSRVRLGSWDCDHRTISISRHHVGEDPWFDVMETLRHEMAHQYAEEVLQVMDETAHGPGFQHACHLLRVEPHARESCSQRTKQLKEYPENVRAFSKVTKLLNLANSPNEHEAQIAMIKARKILLKHNISLSDRKTDHPFEVRHLGTAKRRVHDFEYQLASILNDFFFVQVIWVDGYDCSRTVRGRTLEVYGTPANLDMAEFVYQHILQLLPELWKAYQSRMEFQGNRERLRYFSGVLTGFSSKLKEQDRKLVKEEKALIWKGDIRLKEFFHFHHPRVRTLSRTGMTRTSVFQDGVQDGRNVSIRKPIQSESRGVIGYLSDTPRRHD